MGLLDEARRVAHDAGDEARDRLDHCHHRDLSPVEDVVAETEQPHVADRRGVVEDPLVDALVAAASEDDPLPTAQLTRRRLGEDLARG